MEEKLDWSDHFCQVPLHLFQLLLISLSKQSLDCIAVFKEWSDHGLKQ